MSPPEQRSPLRVLVVTQSYPPEHTGSGLRISATYRRLTQRHDVDHQVLTLSPHGRPVEVGSPPAIRIVAGGGVRRTVTLLRNLWRLGRAADVGHLVGMTLETRLAACVLRLLRVPYTVEPSLDRTPGPPGWTPLGLLTRATDRLLLGNRSFVALTSRIAELHVPPGGDRSGLHLRPNPYYREQVVDEVSGDDEVLEGDPSTVPGYRHLLLGRICPRKGHEQALTWLRGLPDDHTLTIAGPLKEPEDEVHLRSIEATVAGDPQLADRVRIVPRFVHDPVAVLRGFDTIWIPSSLEGMPNVGVEAACQGTIVVMGRWLAAVEWFAAIPGAGVAVGRRAEDAALIERACVERPEREVIAATAREAFDLDRHVDELHRHLRATAGRQPDASSR